MAPKDHYSGGGAWRARSPSGLWDAIPTPLHCVYEPTYCPDLRGVSSDFVLSPGQLAEDEPWKWESIVMNKTLEVKANKLGATATMSCPHLFQRVRGDESVVCEHGP